MSNNTTSRASSQTSEWPAAVVAIGILMLLGAVLVTATARWPAADVKDLIGALAPMLGVVTGAFVTYFFTRHAQAAASNAAQTASDTANRTLDSLESSRQRNRELDKALAAAFSIADPNTSNRMREDRTISAALEPE